ncbi:SHOCT domain-containing protein [Nocardia rhizosphaerae]|uniref:SHOCT domain-containing protein n=1 Tax=Nocardia rhizosphaerae TaxID=1691571 RepID=A0ABV8L4F7_9NOCA
MPLRRGRIGRPGLLGTVARTAVVAGTATATSNAINNRAARHSAQQQAYADQQAAQQQAYAQQAAQQAAQQQAAYAQPPAATPQAAAPVDMVEKLKQLSELHSAGALSDAEFAAAKAQLLG